jgi:hypothetical protein
LSTRKESSRRFDAPPINRKSAVAIALVAAFFVGLPLLGAGVVLFRSGGEDARQLVIGLLQGMAFVAAFASPYAAALRFIRQRIPFTKFPGPVSISLLLDIQSRARYTFNTGMGMVGVFALGVALFSDQYDR